MKGVFPCWLLIAVGTFIGWMSEGRAASAQTRSLGVCGPVEWRVDGADPPPGVGAFGPNDQAVEYMMLYEGRDPDIPPPETVALITPPTHGKVAPYTHPNTGLRLWRYIPDVSFVGEDRAEFKVRVGSEDVRVVYVLMVTKLTIDDGSADRLCKKTRWRISRAPMLPNRSFDADAQRRAFASLRSYPRVAGQLRRYAS